MYRAMASRVVGAARESGAVVLIEPGSPVVTDLLTRSVLEAAHGAGLRTRIVAGISCLEHLCIAFGIDPSSGLQTVLAQELVARRIRLSAGLDTVVIQPGYFDTRSGRACTCENAPSRFSKQARTTHRCNLRRSPLRLHDSMPVNMNTIVEMSKDDFEFALTLKCLLAKISRIPVEPPYGTRDQGVQR
ncbi:hypothetical protein [Paraburkholderia sp. UYCP14C]|uniref:hypothetical protein n=1 Tax=Paraburkholderia sp. UYCP14C TaxID=2511130 RepID=UPI00145A015F|nr:hypothetical protein [Paraburkholderia sp. UYCP14C]